MFKLSLYFILSFVFKYVIFYICLVFRFYLFLFHLNICLFLNIVLINCRIVYFYLCFLVFCFYFILSLFFLFALFYCLILFGLKAHFKSNTSPIWGPSSWPNSKPWSVRPSSYEIVYGFCKTLVFVKSYMASKMEV